MNTRLVKRIKTFVIVLTGLTALYALVGFVILPAVLTYKVPELITEVTGRKASLEKIDFNPFSLELSLTGFEMQEKEAQVFVKFSTFFINIQVWQSLTNSALVIADISLKDPYVRLAIFPDNQFNFSDLLTKDKDAAEDDDQEGEVFPLIIQRLDLSQGQVSVIDAQHTQVITTELRPLNLHIDQFSTLLGAGSKLGFSVNLDSGTSLQWQGDVGVNPMFSKGEIEIKDLQFNQLWALFLQDRVPFKWLSGTQAIKFNYALSYQEALFSFTLNEGFLTTENLIFTAKDNELEQIIIPYFAVQGLDFDLNKQEMHIAQVESQQIALDAWFDPSGALSLQSLFVSPSPDKAGAQIEDSVAEAGSGDKNSPWDMRIDAIALNASKVKFNDQRKQEAVLVNIAALDLGLHDYHLRTENDLVLTAQNGSLNLHDFSLKTLKDAPLIDIPNISVEGVDFDLQNKSVKIAEVNTQSAKINAWLDKQGVMNYQTLFAATPTEASEQQTLKKNEPAEAPWAIQLDKFNLTNYALSFKDYTPVKPVTLQLAEFGFSVQNFSTAKGAQLPISLETRVNQHGNVKVSGSSVLEPFAADLKVDVRHVDIVGFQEYINQFARLDFISGNINTKGQLSLAQATQKDLQLKYRGNVNIAKLHTRDQILNRDFLNWQQLKLNAIDFNLQPLKLSIKSIDLDKPYARVTIKQDKTVNINDVIISNSKESTKKAAAKKQGKPSSAYYNIGKVNISGGSSDFSDYSLILPFVVKMNALGGVIDKVSSNQKTKTDVDISGKVFDLSPIEIKGDFNAGFDDLDIGMHFKSLPLPFISPYMVEFAGYKIEKGKMSLDLIYQVTNRQLSAKNNLFIDQLELGEEVENPDAVNLPLSLAIALLKDSEGKITLNMPLTGSLDDPEFSVGPLLFDTFVNLLSKVIASPFTAIGSFLGSDADFSVISFQPGNAELADGQKTKLDGLRKALIEKPGLSLEVKGGAYTKQDWPAMTDIALREQLQQRRADELKKEGKIQLAEYIQLAEDEYQRLLADLFIESFPDMAERSLFGTPKLNFPEMGEFYAVATNMLQATMQPDTHKLFVLSATRARNIARYLSKDEAIEQARLFILDGKVVPDAENGELNAQLSLKAN